MNSIYRVFTAVYISTHPAGAAVASIDPTRRRQGLPTFLKEVTQVPETKINWINDYEEGCGRAREQRKPLFLDFFKDG
jgi:hypothetical protein